jgi:hypothetical protein
MHKLLQAAVIPVLLLFLAGTAGADGDSVAIRLNNDGTDDVLVTVYDMNADPPGAVIVRQRINGFAWIPISVTAGAGGTGHIRWTATSALPGQHLCGHEGSRGLANDASVRVFADSQCAAGAGRAPPRMP